MLHIKINCSTLESVLPPVCSAVIEIYPNPQVVLVPAFSGLETLYELCVSAIYWFS